MLHGIFPTTSISLPFDSSFWNGQPLLVSPNPPNVVPSTSMDPSPSVAPPSLIPPSTYQPCFVPPLVSSKDKEPIVFDPPSSSQQISNKIKCNWCAHECQKNHQAHMKVSY